MATRAVFKPVDVQDRQFLRIARVSVQATDSGIDLVLESNERGEFEVLGQGRQHVTWRELDDIRRAVGG
jgi:hypothetical protein